MKNDPLNAPLTAKEAAFAEANHYLIAKYLDKKRLSIDEYYDVVVFRFLRSVKRWFAIPDLRKHNFEIVAFYAMRSAIGGEREKQKRRIRTISLDAILQDTEGITLLDTITKKNLDYIPYESGDEMEVSNVNLPPRKKFTGWQKSDEVIAIEGFLAGKMKNMCFTYETAAEAKSKLSTVRSYQKRMNHNNVYDVYRNENCLYVVRRIGERK